MKLLRKPALVGAILGAILICGAQWGVWWLIYLLPQSSRVTFPVPSLQMFLPMLPRVGFFGAVLGAITLSALAVMRSGNSFKAKRIAAMGGGVMTLILLSFAIHTMWSIYQSIGNSGIIVGVPGSDFIPLPLRMILMWLIFNPPLQWAVALLLFGVWPAKSKTGISLPKSAAENAP